MVVTDSQGFGASYDALRSSQFAQLEATRAADDRYGRV